MSVAAASRSKEDALRGLLLALNARAAYGALIELAAESLGATPLGAWIPTKGDRATACLDDAWPLREGLPPLLPSDAELAAQGSFAVPVAYQGQLLLILTFPEEVRPRFRTVTSWLERNFAPGYFRASWLEESLHQNATSEERVRFLREMSALLGQIDLEPLLINVLDLTCGFLGATLGCVVLREESGALTPCVDWGLPLPLLESLSDGAGTGALARVIEGTEPRVLLPDPMPSGFVGGALALPLATTGERLGAVVVLVESSPPDFDRTALEIVQPAIALAATAIANARLLKVRIERERERSQLEVAARIQEGLLPKTAPLIGGIELAARSVPASMVGGDYYDYFVHDDGSVGLLVADISGKGVPGALMMTATRATFRATVTEERSPGMILERVNRALASDDYKNRFVTAILARFDPTTRRLIVAVAGHEPVMIRRKDGRIEHLGDGSLPLAVLQDTAYPEVSTVLEKGDAFLLWTDGVTEARNRKRRLLGREGLEQVVASATIGTAQKLLERVLQRVDAHLNGIPRHDDTTLLVARITV